MAPYFEPTGVRTGILLTAVKRNGLESFTAVGRLLDQACGAGDQAAGTSTNVAQDPLDHTDAFLS